MAKKAKKKKSNQGNADGYRVIARNRRATFDYEIEARFEAGLVLVGSEVKALRGGGGSLNEAYAKLRDGEAWLEGAHIPEYMPASYANHNPVRNRKLLLHRRELDKLETRVHDKGYTLIPLSLYFKEGRAKLELGLGKGKKEFDKREAIKKREATREAKRHLREANR